MNLFDTFKDDMKFIGGKSLLMLTGAAIMLITTIAAAVTNIYIVRILGLTGNYIYWK